MPTAIPNGTESGFLVLAFLAIQDEWLSNASEYIEGRG
jgi:hypothetical protein